MKRASKVSRMGDCNSLLHQLLVEVCLLELSSIQAAFARVPQLRTPDLIIFIDVLNQKLWSRAKKYQLREHRDSGTRIRCVLPFVEEFNRSASWIDCFLLLHLVWDAERASEGRGCLERGTLNADRKANQKGAALFNSFPSWCE
jgi:hypothetical protein